MSLLPPKLWLIALTLGACSGEANHLGNPLTWPGQVISSTLSNAVYDSRRAKVFAYVEAHQAAVLSDAAKGGGTHLAAAMDLARVPMDRQSALTQELAANPIYVGNTDAVVVALMVHGA